MRSLTGISGYVSIMVENNYYLKLSKLNKLKHDLKCLNMAGFSGASDPISIANAVKERNIIKDDIKKMILKEERLEKIKIIKNKK